MIEKITNNLSQITIVWPENRDLFSYRKFMENLDGSQINGVPVKVLKANNEFQSYGQYVHAFKVFGSSFDYYIFTEDDYVPVLNDFDQILVDQFDQMYDQKRCGYLCGFSCPCNATNSPWAAVSWGITRSDVLLDIDFNTEQLKLKLDGSIVTYYAKFQFLFSCIFLNGQYTICDVVNRYKTCFYRTSEDSSSFFGDDQSPELISPIQLQKTQFLYPESFLETHRDGLRLY